ncbi:Hypothetical predicted protein [Pelobates cultripes]|uniref:Uncharacterized protein n=1 Tax=Pelobates cultripes TaxID=61616 RepID=A0AAD1RYF5_PELCU|nr:Hypothetical predicted protein [Pelobates cultripes]
MAEAACSSVSSNGPSKILTRLDKHFLHFWEQLEIKLHQPTPPQPSTSAHRGLPQKAPAWPRKNARYGMTTYPKPTHCWTLRDDRGAIHSLEGRWHNPSGSNMAEISSERWRGSECTHLFFTPPLRTVRSAVFLLEAEL